MGLFLTFTYTWKVYYYFRLWWKLKSCHSVKCGFLCIVYTSVISRCAIDFFSHFPRAVICSVQIFIRGRQIFFGERERGESKRLIGCTREVESTGRDDISRHRKQSMGVQFHFLVEITQPRIQFVTWTAGLSREPTKCTNATAAEKFIHSSSRKVASTKTLYTCARQR